MMTTKTKEVQELVKQLKSLHQSIQGTRIHGGLVFTGPSLETLQRVERFLFLNAAGDTRIKEAYELASSLQILKCTKGGRIRQEVAVYDLSLLIPVMERLSEEEPLGDSDATSQLASVAKPDFHREVQREREQRRRRSSQIDSEVAARKVKKYLAEKNRHTGMTMQMFAELAGTTYQCLAHSGRPPGSAGEAAEV